MNKSLVYSFSSLVVQNIMYNNNGDDDRLFNWMSWESIRSSCYMQGRG